jgi:DivIVA domain-containing protein
MELTAKTIREVTFGAKVRGYDPAEVDEFISAVADGVEEMQERLRRATERATRAEQQVASGGVATAVASEPAPAPVVAATPVVTAPPSNNEISKIWERAVAAAEEAVAEAKETAQRLLAEAQREADSQVGQAREEALRLAEEAQGQLRAEIRQLEQARDQLKSDVDKLSSHMAEEREKVRTVLSKALAAIDDKNSGAAPAPAVDNVEIPRSPLAGIGEWQSSNASSSQASSSQGGSQTGDGSTGGASENPFDRPVVEEAPSSWTGEAAQAGDRQDSLPEDTFRPAPTSDSTAEAELEVQLPPVQVTQPQEEDPDHDPFLAELRKAVQDDGPLGPRDEVVEEDDSIDRLYSDEDDDKSGFFRRKK